MSRDCTFSDRAPTTAPVRATRGSGGRRGMGWHNRNGGFTLLELLVATAIAAIVLLVINATFFSALRLHNTTHEKIDTDLELQRTLGIIRRDLAGIVLPGNPQATNVLFGQLTTETFTSTSMDTSGGERVSPDLYTTSGRIDGWNSFSDVQMVSYFLTPATDGPTKNLVRLVTRNLLPVQDMVGDEQTLLTGIQSATISFYDGTDWTDTWDSPTTSMLPTAIKFSILMAPKTADTSSLTLSPVDLVVPVLATTTASAQAAAAAATGQ
jgi:type II secretion system protein J